MFSTLSSIAELSAGKYTKTDNFENKAEIFKSLQQSKLKWASLEPGFFCDRERVIDAHFTAVRAGRVDQLHARHADVAVGTGPILDGGCGLEGSANGRGLLTLLTRMVCAAEGSPRIENAAACSKLTRRIPEGKI